MQTKVGLISGAGFDAGTILPGPLQEAPPPARRELADDMMRLLTAIPHAGLSVADREELNALVMDRMDLNRRSQAFVDRQHAAAHKLVLREHERSKVRVREAQAAVQAHKNRILQMQMELNRLREIEGDAINKFHVAQQRRKEQSRYASKATIAAADRALAEANDAASAAADACGTLLAQLNNAKFTEQEPLLKRLGEEMAEEARLNHSAYGTSYTTPEGLIVPPRDVRV
jgi:hypothetical protein